MFFSLKCPDQVWCPPILLFIEYQCSLLDIKWPWCEADHSSASSAKIKNERSYTSALPVCLNGMDRNNFTSTTCGSYYVYVLQFINQHTPHCVY